MRIVPYESAAVKVRVEVEAGKLGYFPIHRSKEPVCPGVSTLERRITRG
jgi:hypothetical protein